jgi:hypothetical protein
MVPQAGIASCCPEALADSASSLQDVFVDKALPLDIRYLAVIQLKNGIDKYWRKHAHKYLNRLTTSQILMSNISLVQ